MLKQCPICKIAFKVKPSHAAKRTYCSRVCMAKGYADRMTGSGNPHWSDAARRTCLHCGEEFTSYRKEAKYCSVACRARAPEQVARFRGILHLGNKARAAKAKYAQRSLKLRFGPLLHHLTCVRCGKQFLHRNRNRQTCSKECQIGPRHYIQCAVCGRGFRGSPSHLTYRSRVTCSPECSRSLRSSGQRGSLSHRWKGGATNAAKLFRNSAAYGEWRKAVYERDNYTCQLCGQRGGRLTAHHIRPFSTHPNLRLAVANGISLCWPCHCGIRKREHLYEAQFYGITGGVDE